MLDAGDYQRLLIEIASYGYVIAADGSPTGSASGAQSKVQDMRDSLDWAFAGKAKKYGNIDLTKGRWFRIELAVRPTLTLHFYVCSDYSGSQLWWFGGDVDCIS